MIFVAGILSLLLNILKESILSRLLNDSFDTTLKTMQGSVLTWKPISGCIQENLDRLDPYMQLAQEKSTKLTRLAGAST